MQKREKILAVVVGGLLLLVALRSLFGRVSAALADRRGQVATLQDEIASKETKVDRGNRAAARLAAWEQRSLPSDLELARTLYQNWLLGLVDAAHLSNATVDSSRAIGRRNVYHKLPFTVRGRGTLEQVTRFLYDFYRASHLHQVRNLTIKPIETGSQVEVVLSIEALALPGAERKDKLSEQPATRLAHNDLKEYTRAIVGRNLFAVYTPPPPPQPVRTRATEQRTASSRSTEFDARGQAVLTAILEIGSRPQAWVNVRTTGETLKLSEGDDFRVGEFRAKVVRIGGQDMEILAAGQRQLVGLGESLKQAAPLPKEDL